MQRVLWFLGLALVTMLAHVGKTRAEGGSVRGDIINVFPQGPFSVVIINRGARQGLQVGQVARCHGTREFLCKVREVYEFRSKCFAEVSGADIGGAAPWCEFPPLTRRRGKAKVLERVHEGESTTLVFDKGYQDGLLLGDWGELDGVSCRVWRIEQDRSSCEVDGPPPADDVKELTVVSAFVAASLKLSSPLIAPPPNLEHRAPARGAPAPALPVALTRAPAHGLVAASPCVGFTADERAAYVLRPGPLGLLPWPDERGLELARIELETQGMTTVETFSPSKVSTARARLAELVAREGLLACHAAESTTRSTAGDKGLMAHHRLDRILFWSSEDTVYAAMEGGAGLAERVGRGPLYNVWFVPGFARHLGQAAQDWQVLEVR